MIRVRIVADTLERAQSLAGALGENDHLEIVETRSLAADTDWDHGALVDTTIALGLTPDEVHRVRGPVVVLAEVAGRERFGRAVRAWLPLTAAIDEIEAAALAAAHDFLVLTSEQARRYLRKDASENETEFAEALTARELQVLRMLADGFGNREIAAKLGISGHTAKFHVSQILAKLGVTSRAEAVATGMRRGLVPI